MKHGYKVGTAMIAVGAAAVLFLTSAATSTSAASPADPPRPAVAPHDVGVGGHFNTYVPVAPCRIVDTHGAVAGNLVAGHSRNFVVAGTTGFAPQGGHSGGCGIPAVATAVTVTMSATQVTGHGFLKAWAQGAAEPGSTALLLSAGNQLTGTTVPINSGMTVKPYSGNGRLVVDVTGYYAPPIYAVIMSAGSNIGSSRLGLVSHTAGTGYYTLQTDSSIDSCAVEATSFATNNAAAYASGSYIYVQTANSAGSAADFYFQVAVTC